MNKHSTIITVVLCILAVALGALFAKAIRKQSNDSPLPPSPISIQRALDLNEFVYLPFVAGGGLSLVLENLGFEGGEWDGDQIQWKGDAGPFKTHYTEIRLPYRWNVAWVEQEPCSATPAYPTGRPEVHLVTDIPDPLRVGEGAQAVVAFNVWRCSLLALFQRVSFFPGEYQFSALIHSWYSNCNSPHDPWPGNEDRNGYCYQIDAHAWLQVCVDPFGGIDPFDPDVVCNSPAEIYGGYSSRVLSPWIELNGPATLFLRIESDMPLHHVDTYWDDVQMEAR